MPQCVRCKTEPTAHELGSLCLVCLLEWSKLEKAVREAWLEKRVYLGADGQEIRYVYTHEHVRS